MEDKPTTSTLTDTEVTTSVMNKLGEAFENFQSNAVSILSLSKQWKSLQSSFAIVEASMASREKELQSKERELSDLVKRVEVLQEEVELSKKMLDLGEKLMNERAKEVDKREKGVIERGVIEERESGICERDKELEMREKEFDDRCKINLGFELREKEIKEHEERLKLKKREIEERDEALELKQKEVNEGFVALRDSLELKKEELIESRRKLALQKKCLEVKAEEMFEERKVLELKEEELSEWRKVEISAADRVKELESKEKVIIEGEKRVEKLQEEVALREKCVSERVKEVERKEEELKEKVEAFNLEVNMKSGEIVEMRGKLMEEMKVKEEEINERFEAVEVSEKQMDERRSALDCREQQLNDQREVVELKSKQINERSQCLDCREQQLNDQREDVELKSKQIDERSQCLDCRELQLNDQRKAVELKSKEIDERSQCLELKSKQMDERSQCLELKSKQMDERSHCLELKSKQMDERSQCLELKSKQIDERSQFLELKEKEWSNVLKSQELNDKQNREFPTRGQMKTREPLPEVCNEVQLICRNMDSKGMRSYFIEYFKNYKETDTLLKNVFDSLQLSLDPAKFVLDVIQSFHELLDSNNVSGQIFSSSCLVLLTRLIKLRAAVTPHVKEDAGKFSVMWKSSFAKRGSSPLEIYVFLLFLASFKAAQSYDSDELLSLLGTFYTDSEVLWPEQDSYLCRILGLKKKIPGLIQSLITREELLRAVVYVCAFKMEDAFPPASLLQAHMASIQKRVQTMVKKGSDEVQKDAVDMEVSALKTILKCISNFKLESSFSPAPLESRLKQLDGVREGKTNDESLSTGKKNLSNSEKKGNALPVVDQSYTVIGKKHTSTSIGSPKPAKRPKVDARPKIIIKIPSSLPGSK